MGRAKKNATKVEPVEHGVAQGVYDNLIGGVILFCLCGKGCHGDRWEDAGAALDDHLEEVTP